MRKLLTTVTILTILFLGIDLIKNEVTADASTKIQLISHKITPKNYTLEVTGDPGTRYEIFIVKYQKEDDSWLTVSSGTGNIDSNGTTGKFTWVKAFKGPGEYIAIVHARSGPYSYHSRRITIY